MWLQRIARVVAWLVGITVTIAIIAGVAIYAYFSTDVGRERTRQVLERVGSERLNGELSIGRLRGSVFGDTILEDVVVRDAGGQEVIRADEVEVEFELWPLLSNRFEASRVSARGLEVHAAVAPDGRLDLASLPAPRELGEPWAVAIEQLELADASFELVRINGDRYTVTDLSLEAAVDVESDGAVNATLARLSARWREKGLPVGAAGHVTWDERLAVDRAWLIAGRSRLDVPHATYDPAGGRGEAAFAARITGRDARRFAPRAPGNTARIAGVIARGAADRPIAITAAGTVGGSPVAAIALFDPDEPAIRVVAHADRVRPHRWLAGAPEGVVAATVHAEVHGGFELATARGSARIDARGEMAGVEADAVSVDAELAGGVIGGELDARTDRGRLRGRVRARVAGGPRWAELDLTGRALRWAGARVRRVAVGARIRGALDAAEGTISIDARDVRGGGERIDRLVARLRIEEGGVRIAGRVRAGDRRGRYWARARGSAVRTDRRWRVSVPGLTVGTGSLVWRGEMRGRVGPGGQVVVTQARLASAAGEVRGAGELPGRDGGGRIELVADHLDLGRVRRALPASVTAPAITGRASLTAEVDLRAGRGRARGHFIGVCWDRRMPLLSGRVAADLAAGHLAVSGLVGGAGAGRVELELAAGAPRRVGDLAAWTRGARDRLDRVDVRFAGVDLGVVARLAGSADDVAGTISGTVRADGALEHVDGHLRVRGARGGRVRGAIDIDLRGSAVGGRIRGRARASTAAGGALFDADVELGTDLASLWRAPRRLATAPLTAELEMPMTPARRLAGIVGMHGAEIGGRVGGHLRVSGTVRAPRFEARIDGRGVGAGGLRFRSVEVRGRADGQRWNAALSATQAGGGTARARASGAVGVDGAIEARVRARDLDIEFVDAIAREAGVPVGGIAGAVDADLSVEGTFDQLSPSGTVHLRDGRVRIGEPMMDLRAIGLGITLDGSSLAVRGQATSPGGGRIELALSGRRQGMVPIQFTGHVSVDDLALIAAGARIVATADADLRFEQSDDAADLWIEVASGAVRLPKRLDRSRLHSTGRLEDVVYTDQLSSPADAPRADAVTPTRRAHLTTKKPVKVIGDGDLDAQVAADLTVTSSGGGVTLEGTLTAERGTLFLFDREYDIRFARVEFEGRSPIDPTFEIRLAHRFDAATLLVRATGTLDQPRVDLASDPGNYSRSELLAWLLGGDPGQRTRPGAGNAAAQAASAVVASQIEGVVADRVPIDSVRLGSNPEDASISHVTVGKWLTEELFVAFRRRFEADENENLNEAQVEYELSPRWMIEGRYGDRGAGGVDLLWFRRFKK